MYTVYSTLHDGPQAGLWGCTMHCCINRFGKLGVAKLPQGNCTCPHRLYRPSDPRFYHCPPFLLRSNRTLLLHYPSYRSHFSLFTLSLFFSLDFVIPSLSLSLFLLISFYGAYATFSCGATGHAARLFSSHLLCKRTQSRQSHISCRIYTPIHENVALFHFCHTVRLKLLFNADADIISYIFF